MIDLGIEAKISLILIKLHLKIKRCIRDKK